MALLGSKCTNTHTFGHSRRATHTLTVGLAHTEFVCKREPKPLECALSTLLHAKLARMRAPCLPAELKLFLLSRDFYLGEHFPRKFNIAAIPW